MQFGTVVAMTAGGYLSASSFLGGWPSVFYVFGTVGLAWGIPWFLLVHDRPELHPSISRAELEYLRANKDTVKGAEVRWLSRGRNGKIPKNFRFEKQVKHCEI